jgi:type II secretory ATPase GspE/PulE/Tfp pilus assembly ATPase PilB-like protein
MGHSQNAQVRQIGTVDKQTHLWQSVLEVTQWALEQGANDIDYLLRMDEPTSQIAFKIDGRYVRPARWAVPTPTMRQMLSVAWQRSSGGKDAQFQVHSEQQAGLEVNLPSGKTVRLRWSGMATDNGCAVTQRIQPPSTTLRTLEQAGCLAWQIGAFNRALKSRGGITTLAGVVGSGKSHTLASLMCMLNALYECKIVEVSSPVEIELPFAIQKTIIQDLAKTGDSSQIASAIRAILRSALDKLLLGEIRDVETGLLARAIIESRHSVFATTHASGALGIFAKYASPQVGIPLEVLAEPGNIRLNVFQSLLPTLCVCSITVEQHLDMHAHDRPAQESTQRFFDRVERLYNLPRERFKMRNPHGCPICNRVDLPMFTGLYGRTLVMEMVEPDEGLCELLQNNDRIGMGRYWRSLASERFDDPMLAGKTAMECAVYKAQLGQIDLRDVESHFESFESVEYQRERRRAS